MGFTRQRRGYFAKHHRKTTPCAFLSTITTLNAPTSSTSLLSQKVPEEQAALRQLEQIFDGGELRDQNALILHENAS